MNTLHDQLLGRFVPEQQLGVQLPRHIIDRLPSRMKPLRNGQPNLLNQSLHIHLLERTPDDDVGEERGGGEGDDETGGDDGEGAEEVESELIPRESGFTRYDKLVEKSCQRVKRMRGGRDERA